MIGKRPLPAMSPIRSPVSTSIPPRFPRIALFLVLLLFSYRSANTTLGAIQKGDDLHHIHMITKLVPRLLDRFSHPVPRPKQHFIGPLEHGDALVGETLTFEADRVHPVQLRAIAARCAHEWGNIPPHRRTAPDHHIGTHPHILMNSHQP